MGVTIDYQNDGVIVTNGIVDYPHHDNDNNSLGVGATVAYPDEDDSLGVGVTVEYPDDDNSLGVGNDGDDEPTLLNDLCNITTGRLCKELPEKKNNIRRKVGRVPVIKDMVVTYNITIKEKNDVDKMKSEFVKLFNYYLFYLCNLLKPSTVIYVKGNITHDVIRECIIHLASNEYKDDLKTEGPLSSCKLKTMFDHYQSFHNKFVHGLETLTFLAGSYKRYGAAKYVLYMTKYVLDHLSDIFIIHN